MRFGEKQLTRWMELVRTYDDGIEAFWPSQIKSKTDYKKVNSKIRCNYFWTYFDAHLKG